MKFKFWGVRGSIPVPGANTVKYGGNTTCIEVRTFADDLIILDAGTGIHAMAQSLVTHLPVKAHILITHTHWDHIQGLPFFLPIFGPGNHVNIYGGLDPVTGQGIDRALSVQLQYSYFPIIEAQLKADIRYHTIKPGEPITIGSATITPIVLSHPVLNFGYRIDDSDGSSLFFTGDYEPAQNPYQAGEPEYNSTQQFIDERLAEVVRTMAGADALIIDSSYTDAEYQQKKGWGHGTYGSSLNLARLANVRKLFLTHHEPTRTDQQLEAIYRAFLNGLDDPDVEIYLAREGDEYGVP
ncbi:MAG: MBL fold metallo-hydrolase [Methylococcaceae bacterium]|nr:MBL fold metallo-hydrolase [Methylococcaceae bacterium]